MKAQTKRLILVRILIAGLIWGLAGQGTSQNFKTLHSFTAFSGCCSTNSDGATPFAGLILLGNTLYGTAQNGGSSGNGTVFALDTNGTGFTNLHSFAAFSDYPVNSDGVLPVARLVVSSNALYGTASGGGGSGRGTVFALGTDGTGFTTLHSLTNSSDGGAPNGGLISSSNRLYGTAEYGGSANAGTVYALNTDGMGFGTLYDFTGGSDGATPTAGLILLGDTLYGTTGGGGFGRGTVFAVNVDGTGFTNLYSFTATSTNSSGAYTNGDGAYPHAALILSSNTLYGATYGGGSSGNGTVFALNTDGTGFSNLYTFTAGTTNSSGTQTNGDGANPRAGLVLSGKTLYGTAYFGGDSGNGTVFAVNTDGTGFMTLHSFALGAYDFSSHYTNCDGAHPSAGLVLAGNTLCGTTYQGGVSGNGTVFSISLPVSPPQLSIAADSSGGYFIRIQGTPNLTYRLQRAHNLTGSWTTSAPQTAPASGLIEFHDLFPPSDRAFYRALQQ